MKKVKKVRVNNESEFLAGLHTFIYENTNALISLEISRLCRKFIKDLKEIPLSEEQQ